MGRRLNLEESVPGSMEASGGAESLFCRAVFPREVLKKTSRLEIYRSMGKIWGLAAAFAIMAVGEANAQNAGSAPLNGSNPPSQPVTTATATNSSGQTLAAGPTPYLIDLRLKPIVSLGKALADDGIYFTGFNDLIYSGVPAGGLMHGTFATNWGVLGVNLDLNRIAGIHGAMLHFIADDVGGYGHNWKYTGADWSFLENWGNHDGLQLREFSWDQALFDDHLYLLAGRTAPKSGEYDGSELYCLFDTFMCSTPTQYGASGSPPSFVTSTWGFRILYKPTKDTYAKVGVWEDEPLLKTADQNGWPGEDWNPDKVRGAFIPAEMGYKTTFADDKYPRHYDIGFTYDTAPYTDPLLNTRGQVKPLFGGTALPRAGRSEIFLQAQQMVWRPDFDSTRGITLFGAINMLTSGDAPMRNSIVAGVFDRGPFETRPFDFVGVVAENFWWDSRYRDDITYLIQKDGSPHSSLAPAETMLEALYSVNLGPGINLSPYFEYIWNPDLMADAKPVAGISYAIQAGLRLNFMLNDALGLPALDRVRD